MDFRAWLYFFTRPRYKSFTTFRTIDNFFYSLLAARFIRLNFYLPRPVGDQTLSESQSAPRVVNTGGTCGFFFHAPGTSGAVTIIIIRTIIFERWAHEWVSGN